MTEVKFFSCMANPGSPHGVKRIETDDSDPLDKLLNDTGCADLHYKVQV